MRADELRRAFTRFFEERGHTLVPSSSLIPHHPSAPMFTNSGMMQFVPYFAGEEVPPFGRAASVQKCVRAGGKHNDLDAIGRSLRHLSFFEMLGNFSFGDYFKAEAIPWAHELVTEVLGLDQDRLWVTVHTSDDEAEEIWVDAAGFPRERIQRLDADNFWEMGETGPCGPSTEVFWDFGPEAGVDGGPAHGSEERFVEIWNLVFTQYFREADGSLSPLPKLNVDTGAGLERILGVIAGSPSLYAADTLAVLVDEAQSLTGRRLGDDPTTDVALRLLADHTRTMTFLVADGVVPSNEDRGYVLRRIIRRAIRFAYLLGVEREVCAPLAERCVSAMADAYPELSAQHELVLATLDREEQQFRQRLTTGLTILDAQLAELPEGGTLPGGVAFQLHDTHGFPVEVTREIVEDRGYGVDLAGFEAAMAEQRERAKAASRKGGVAAGQEAEAFRALLEEHGPTDFTGRDEEESKATVLAVLPSGVVLDRTPFYAESGGQVGDTGWIASAGARARVLDTTYALPGLALHHVELERGELAPGDEVVVTIDGERRAAIRRNHTGTHVLHWALREVLGDHVKQQGSLVAPDRLRFDFSHHAALTPDEVRRIEDLANHEILGNEPVRHYETTMEQARELGAIAFFGEKYGEVVRVLEAGSRSIELCGGTHVRALGDIGPLKIVSEGSIGSNIRRIEAVTGTGPIERLREEEDVLARAAALVGVPAPELLEGLEKRLAQIDELRDEVRALRRQAAAGRADELLGSAVDGVVVARVEAATRDEVRDLAVSLRDRPGVRAVVLGASPGGKGVALVAAVAPGSDLQAGPLIADAARTVGGGAGKGSDLAVAGGRDPSRLDEALDVVRRALGIG